MLAWRKSSYSGGGGTTDCVELAAFADVVGIRDSKCVREPYLAIKRADLATLLGRIKAGELDF